MDRGDAEFLGEVRGMPQRNLAVELLEKLLKAGELRMRGRKNVVQAQSFAEMLEQTIRRYQNRAIEAAQVIEELIELAKEMREANERGEKFGLTEDELAFYDALGVNDSAVKILGDDVLREIAHELVSTVRKNVTIDWTCGRTSAPTCGCSSSASSASTATPRTGPRGPPPWCWSRPRCSRPSWRWRRTWLGGLCAQGRAPCWPLLPGLLAPGGASRRGSSARRWQ